MGNLREVGGFRWILEVGSVVYAKELDVKRKGKRGVEKGGWWCFVLR